MCIWRISSRASNPIDIATVVELHATADGVRMVLTFDAMHSDEWMQRVFMGWQSELDKLAAVLAERLEGGQL
jgi:hypothetical protein